MRYRLMAISWTAALVTTAYCVAHDVLGPGVWRGDR